jgi:hypothetical protein
MNDGKSGVPAWQQNGEGYGLNVESATEGILASCFDHSIALLNFIDNISNMPFFHTTPLDRGRRILECEAMEFAINRTSIMEDCRGQVLAMVSR